MRPRLLLAMLLVLPVSAPAAELSGRDVMIRMFMARAQGADDAASVFRLDLVSRDGSAVTRTVATYRKQCGESAKSLAVFQAPPDVAGTALLTSADPERGEEMWAYHPELGRVRQINASARGETFMGSDFTYEDLGMVAVDARRHRLAAGGRIGEKDVYKVESVPVGDDAYGKVVTWVSRDTFLPVRVEYFDRIGMLQKIARFSDVRTVKDIPTPFAIEMENVQTGHQTRLTLLEADYRTGPDCERFSPRFLPRGP